MTKLDIEGIKIRSDILSTWVGIIALIVSATFGLWEYHQKGKAEQIKVSLDFLDRYDKEPLVGAKQKLADTWIKYDADFDRLKSLNKLKYPQEEYDSLVLGIVRDYQLDSDIGDILEFYAALNICVKKKICDGEIAIALFQADAFGYYHQFYPYIEHQRVSSGDKFFAKEIEEFATMK